MEVLPKWCKNVGNTASFVECGDIYGVLYIIDYDDRDVEDVLKQTSINMF